jgi:hypothetical protein
MQLSVPSATGLPVNPCPAVSRNPAIAQIDKVLRKFFMAWQFQVMHSKVSKANNTNKTGEHTQNGRTHRSIAVILRNLLVEIEV